MTHRLEEIFQIMLDREDIINAKLAASVNYSEENIHDLEFKSVIDENNRFFVLTTNSYDTIMTADMMLIYLAEKYPKWYKEIQKLIKKPEEKDLYNVLLDWFKAHPRITKTIKADWSLNELTNRFEDNTFDIFEDISELGGSWVGWMEEISCIEKLIMISPTIFIHSLLKNAYLNVVDQTIVHFREELGVHSLKEIKSIESAICYLLYRSDWLNKYSALVMDTQYRWKIYRNYFNYVDHQYPKVTVYEYLSNMNQDIWSTYEEFLHDEWLDENYSLNCENDSSSDTGENWMMELYDKMRNKN